jgi:nitrite reductase/ring-hydroxylating ferredoxin subunit
MAETIRVDNVKLPEEGKAVRVDAGGTPVAVYREGGELFAIDARCTHVGGPLDQGLLKDTHVTCPWHGSVFDIRNGTVIRGPATRPEASYRVRAEGQTLVLERV